MRTGRFVGLALAVCLLAVDALGQSAAKEPPVFDVATIKPVDQHKITSIDLRVYPGGRLVIHAHRLAMLIAEAFNIPEWEIVGGDESVLQAWYDVEAEPSDALRDVITGGEYSVMGIKDPRVRLMLQALLIERFHLKHHMESQAGEVYELERSDGPMRLKRAEMEPSTHAEDGKGTTNRPLMTNVIRVFAGAPVAIYQTSMKQLAQALASIRRTPVNDQTGLPGYYNFQSRTIVTKEDFRDGDPMHLLADAVPEMGLKLVKANGTVEKFVIDNVEPPTPN